MRAQGKTILGDATSLMKMKEQRKKLLYTLAMLLVYRIGCSLPVPGVMTDSLKGMADDSIFGIMSLLGGGSIEKMSIFAMGIGPYITTSIIIQLLSMDVIPYLAELSKQGEKGKVRTEEITRRASLLLALVQAFSITYALDRNYSILTGGFSWSRYIFTALMMTAGTMFLIWIGGRISAKGIGNGQSLIIFAGIVSGMPAGFRQAYAILTSGTANGEAINGTIYFILYCLLCIAMLVFVVFIETSKRKIPVQYANGGMSHMPIKVNSSSVIPVIFAQSVMAAPQIIAGIGQVFGGSGAWYEKIADYLTPAKPVGMVIYLILILVFSFFYSEMQIDPEKAAENLGQSNAFIPGVRPGKDTENYIHKVLYRVTFYGALALALVAAVPYLISMFTPLPYSSGAGGTGLIIASGVAMEAWQQMKSQLATTRPSLWLSKKKGR